MAVRSEAIVDRGEIGLVVRATTERGDDVVYGVSARLLADVADARVATKHVRPQSLPVRREREGAVSHEAMVPLDIAPSLR